MNIFKKNKNLKTQIVATIGPACRDMDTINKMTEAGMNIARLNFSWGTYDEHSEYIKKIRDAAENFGKHVPIIQDLSGPREQTSNGHQFEEGTKEVLTDKDLRDLDFGATWQLEYVAMSYTGDAQDILRLKKELLKRNYKAKVIAKIERAVAVKNLNSIIRVSDAIMVARGDLGNEFPLEKIPHIQKYIIERCRFLKKPCITATQMMISLKDNPNPTRAEVTDVTYAVILGTDAVMLSDETAGGKYPIDAVSWMNKITRETEKYTKNLFRKEF